MKELRGIAAVTAGTIALTAIAQPVMANPVQVTNVRLNPTATGIDLVLETQGGDRAPQVFNVNRGNTWNAYLFNAQLAQEIRQDNPAPGIRSVIVTRNSGNGVQVTVVGENSAPTGQVVSRNAQGVILSVTSSIAQAPGLTPQAPMNTPMNAPMNVSAQPPAPQSQQQMQQFRPIAQVPSNTPRPPATPVAPFVPNPQLQNTGAPSVPVAPVPPLLRRAVAPPVGDQAVAQIDPSPTAIDLGTNERIPRLVLRDAPVREVLSLLARAAGLNLAYSEGAEGQLGGGGGAAGGKSSGGPTISLDIENESVQDVFNHVLRITCVPAKGGTGGSCASLEANRSGRTLFVGTRLPDDARNVITRTIRLNQISAADAAGFLTTQGGETQRSIERVRIEEVGQGNNRRFVETREPAIIALKAEQGEAPLVLRGLAISTNDRLNTITVTGSPKKVEIAGNLLAQLDARKRQVAMNVKIVDINLLKTEDFNTSFSFGVGRNFFNVDGGAAVFNFGQYRPATNAEAVGSLTGNPTINNPYADSNTFLNLGESVSIPNTQPGFRAINNGFLTTNIPNSAGQFLTRTAGTGNPFQAGVTNVTPATQDVTTTTVTPGTNGGPPTVTSTFTAGTVGNAVSELPKLFQYPSRLLARLQAQVTSGNAKVLADPTVVVQDGETSTVKLVQEVFSGFKRTNFIDEPIIREAGLLLNLKVDRIDDNGFVTVRVNPIISAPANAVQTPQGIITLIQGRSVESGAIRLRDGQTLILSGIIQETDRATVTKLPILGDLPLLGSLFRKTNRQNDRQEVVVMLTPQILDDSDRSGFGYGYVPGKEVRQFIQQQNR